MKQLIAALIGIAVSVAPAHAQMLDRGKVEDWRTDLEFLRNELDANHPKLFSGQVRRDFDASINQLEKNLPALSRDRVVMEIARTLALLRDGHTQINPANDAAIGFHRYPLRLYWYSDGIFVRGISPEYRKYSGARLIDVGGVPIATLVHRLRPYIHGDNEMTIRDVMPSRLGLAEVLLIIRGTTSPDSARFRFQLSNGVQESVTMKPIPVTVPAAGWVTARDTTTAPPLYLRNATRTYWFEHLDGTHTVYAQINAVANSAGETMKSFCSRLFAQVDSVHADRLVLDIRLNNGGDNTLNAPCVQGLANATRVNQRGKLFVIIGRLTFSAAMNLAVDIERNSAAIFVGEPTGASPNHYGETRSIALPRSGVTVLHSTKYWQSSYPSDKRPWIKPLIKAELSSKDFRLNADPAMAAINRYVSEMNR